MVRADVDTVTRYLVNRECQLVTARLAIVFVVAFICSFMVAALIWPVLVLTGLLIFRVVKHVFEGTDRVS